MVRHGLLTKDDAEEVESLVSLLVDKVRAGDISPHFFEVVVDKLGAAKCAAWRARNREGSK